MTTQWKSVVFVDLDHTVIKGPWDTVVFPTVCSEIARKTRLEPETVRLLLFRENFSRQRDPDCPAALAMDWDSIAKTVARHLGVELEANVLDLVLANAGAPHSRVLDHADMVFSRLLRRHRAIVAATKAPSKYQWPILEALRLARFFDGMCTPDTTGTLKRDKAFYGEWLCSSELQIIVGDQPEDDVIAPHRFGFITIWKPRSPEHENLGKRQFAEKAIEPDAIIHSLEELPDVVERFELQSRLPRTKP
jgi:FMN phosphatase YigB (HAD superfamily)